MSTISRDFGTVFGSLRVRPATYQDDASPLLPDVTITRTRPDPFREPAAWHASFDEPEPETVLVFRPGFGWVERPAS